jgi:uncharacterized membrane protein YfcA
VNTLLLLGGAGLLAGAMNSLAGGGSFASFPALVAAGLPPVAANASSAVALYPGGLSSAWVFRRSRGPIAGVPLSKLAAVTVCGGLVGALLLIETPGATFQKAVPWLLLAATIALALGREANALVGSGSANHRPILAGQALLGVYAGYFGGAAGIMMAAFWAIAAGCDAKAVQAQRTLLVAAANSAAVLLFCVTGIVDWAAVLVLAPAALAGGYLGALIGLRLRPAHVRSATVAMAAAVTLAFFVRAYA